MKNIFIAIIVIVMLPLFFASMTEKETQQELKGFSARDIQYIESIGFVDNLDGSWTATTNFSVTSTSYYEFDFTPIIFHGTTVRTDVTFIRVLSTTILRIINGVNDGETSLATSSITIYGGDLS